MLFYCIRSRGGWNYNPNTLQFTWALHRNNIQASNTGNCTDLEKNYTEPLQCTDKFDNAEHCTNAATNFKSESLIHVQENILYYITGYIARKYLKKTRPHLLPKNYYFENCREEHDYNKIGPAFNKYCVTQFKSRGEMLFVNRQAYYL